MSFPKGDSRLDLTADYPCESWYAPDEMVRGILSTVPPEEGYRVLVVGCGSRGSLSPGFWFWLESPDRSARADVERTAAGESHP